MKFGAVAAARGRGRHRGAFDPQGRLGAQEGHADRHKPRSRRSRPPALPRSWWRGSSRATCRRMWPPPRSRRRSRARACTSIAPSPAAPICSPRRRACWWSTRTAIDRLNEVDEAITFATLPAFEPVVAGEMIATVKIIPFAVAGEARDKALAAARARQRRSSASRRSIRKVGIISTLLPGLADKVIEKTLKMTAERLAPAGATHRRRAARAARAGRRSPRRIDEVLKSRRRAGHRVRRLGDRRPARRHPGRDRGGRRRDRAFRHAGRSRQSAAGRPTRGQAGARRARLRALAEGKRLRLGADAAARRPAGQRAPTSPAWASAAC